MSNTMSRSDLRVALASMKWVEILDDAAHGPGVFDEQNIEAGISLEGMFPGNALSLEIWKKRNEIEEPADFTFFSNGYAEIVFQMKDGPVFYENWETGLEAIRTHFKEVLSAPQ